MLFRIGYTITRFYGEEIDYYKKVSGGLLTHGHEGLDIVPKDLTNTDVLSVSDGICIKDFDTPNGVYGIYVVIWNVAKREAFFYCHLAQNFVTVGESVKEGQAIGIMGDTGNTTGPHLHFGYVQTDSNGIRLNTDNGSLGFLDPLPILQSMDNTSEDQGTIAVPKKDFPNLVHGSTQWDSTCNDQQLGDPKTTGYDKLKSVIGGYKSRITDIQNQLTTSQADGNNKDEQISRLKSQLLDEQKLRSELSNTLQEETDKINKLTASYEGRLTVLQGQVDVISKEKGQLNLEVAQLKKGLDGMSVVEIFSILIKKLMGK